MTTKAKIEVRLSKVRERMREIAALEGDDLTPEIRAEGDDLHGEADALEERLRLAVRAGEPAPTMRGS